MHAGAQIGVETAGRCSEPAYPAAAAADFAWLSGARVLPAGRAPVPWLSDVSRALEGCLG